ncbi:DNA polymerase epsilon subunit 2 [Diaphorina citri]|uniref:DNA polymerase II subunit 2 n=1 Tax=Diaphorina citri TaxID=121845 RepID=A0A3Q0J9P0_DIACI|nr:DNA polymerase epsilon subunit 2 [Diaphorina citri]
MALALCSKINKEALSFLVQQLEPIPSYERDSWLDKLIDQIHKQTIGSQFVEKSHIEEALKECCRTEINSEEQIFSVISAFDIPQFDYDPDLKKFKLVDKKRKLCADSDAKSKLFRERYNIIRQRTLRHSLFNNINPNADSVKLDWVEYLMSLTNVNHKTVVLGMISQLKENITTSGLLGECCRTEINSEEQIFSVISAFDIPQFDYDPDLKKFKLVDKKRKLCADSDAKSKLFRERYNIIRQRTLRHSLFNNINPNADSVKLDWVEYLMSLTNVNHKTVVLGMISQLKENRYFLEDPTGIVQLDLSQTSYHPGLYTENCIVLVEGHYKDQILHVDALGFPPPEASKNSRLYFGNQNIWGGPSPVSLKSVNRMTKMEKNNENAMIVILSDVHLDNDKDRRKPAAEEREFLSVQYGHKHSHVLKEKLGGLGMLIADHTFLSGTHFVLVPAQNDSPHVNILPRPALPKFITSEFQGFVPNSTMATNPCRVQYCSQEILVVREELLSKMCRNCIKFPEEGDISKHFVRTLVSQGTLVSLPLNLCPVYWSQYGALSLYPLPDLVILGDQLNAYTIQNTDCIFINPGSFVKQDFGFKVYIPSSKQVEDSQIPEDE